jgi:hypothetical protein
MNGVDSAGMTGTMSAVAEKPKAKFHRGGPAVTVGVEWDLAAFRRAGFVGRSGSLVELRVHDGIGADAALVALSGAVGVANDVLASAEASGRDLYGLVRSVAPGPRGPVAVLDECEPVEALRLYLHALAQALADLGIGGRLVPLPMQDLDDWYGNNTYGCLAALLQVRLDVPAVLATWDSWSHQPALRWHVDASTTDDVLGPLLGWVLAGGRQVELWQGMTHLEATAGQVTGLVRDGLAAGLSVKVMASDGPARMRSMRVGGFGDVLVQDYEPERPREQHLSGLTSLLTELSGTLRGGWVQEADTAVEERRDLLTRVPPDHPLMERIGNAVWRLFHLEPSHLVDAFVAQLVSDAQLARARDLSPGRWDVTALGDGHHLVVARDPRPWFDLDPVPLPARPGYDDAWRRSPVHAVDATALALARADFGGAIMTLETLDEHPFVEPSG